MKAFGTPVQLYKEMGIQSKVTIKPKPRRIEGNTKSRIMNVVNVTFRPPGSINLISIRLKTNVDKEKNFISLFI